MEIKLFQFNQAFALESGDQLPGIEIAYHTFGKLNSKKNNVIWVCHALTANSNVFEWWPGLFGENDLFNPTDYFIVCANNLGSCYGSTGPLSINHDVGLPYYAYFPEITIRDMVNAHDLLRQHLGIEKIHTLIGGSQGGQQVLEWVAQQNDLATHCIVLACNAQHSPWGIAFNEAQRMAIFSDRTYHAHTPEGGSKGMAAARAIALLSYRNYQTYFGTQSEESNDKRNSFKAASYQRYQGEKLVKRFNAYSYVALSKAMDSHNLARNRNSLAGVLNTIQAKTLVIGISSDLLFPVQEQKLIAEHIPGALYKEIESFFGHDGFLIETKKISDEIALFYNEVVQITKLTV